MKLSAILYVFGSLFALLEVCLGSCVADPSSPMLAGPIKGKTGIDRIITEDIWDMLIKGTVSLGSGPCSEGFKFFKYAHLIKASKSFPKFGNTGNWDIDRREIAAFLAHSGHETTGGWKGADCGRRAYGYCFNQERGCSWGGCEGYCQEKNGCLSNFGYECPCVPDKTYHGRGPIQLSWNYNYAQASKALLGDPMILLKNPDMITDDPVFAWKTALWFWMTPQGAKPSNHQIMTGAWEPDTKELANGFRGGFGATINVVNGGLECGCVPANDGRIEDRVEMFKRLSGFLGVSVCSSTTHSLRCSGQPAFGKGGPACGLIPSSDECAGATGDVGVVPPEVEGAPETPATPDSETGTGGTGAPPSGTCKRNMDCTVNAWCRVESYDSYCALNEKDCPGPQCTRGVPEVQSTQPVAPQTTRPVDPDQQTWPQTARPVDPDQQTWPQTARPVDPDQQSWPQTTRPVDPDQQTWPQTTGPEDPDQQSWPQTTRPVDPDQQSWPQTTGPVDPAAGTCRRNMNCEFNAWCKVESYDSYCALNEKDCPRPQCTRGGPDVASTQPVAPQTPRPVDPDQQSSPQTTRPVDPEQQSWPVAQQTTTTPAGACHRNMNCEVNAWCNVAEYDSYCELHASTCPQPFCTKGGEEGGEEGPSTEGDIGAPLESGKCVHNVDCKESQWCSQTNLVAYCSSMTEGYCPTPMCIKLSGRRSLQLKMRQG